MSFDLSASLLPVSDPFKTRPSEDCSWIESLKQLTNPLGIKPSTTQTRSIQRGWLPALRQFIVQDFRDGVHGMRVHEWTEHSCLIVYYLTMTPALCNLMGFKFMSDAEVLALGDFFDNFATNAVWIYAPRSCYQPKIMLNTVGMRNSSVFSYSTNLLRNDMIASPLSDSSTSTPSESSTQSTVSVASDYHFSPSASSLSTAPSSPNTSPVSSVYKCKALMQTVPMDRFTASDACRYPGQAKFPVHRGRNFSPRPKRPVLKRSDILFVPPRKMYLAGHNRQYGSENDDENSLTPNKSASIRFPSHTSPRLHSQTMIASENLQFTCVTEEDESDFSPVAPPPACKGLLRRSIVLITKKASTLWRKGRATNPSVSPR